MKNILVTAVILVVCFLALGAILQAQNATISPYQFSVSSATHTSCVVQTSTTNYCFASDGIFESINGAAYIAVGGSAPAITLTLNGVAKTLPNSFTITESAPTITAPTASAPAVTVQ